MLCKGWYGTKTVVPGKEYLAKKEVDCAKLWARCLVSAPETFVKICQGIEGNVRALTIDKNYTPEEVELPIDTLIVDLTQEEEEKGGKVHIDKLGLAVASI